MINEMTEGLKEVRIINGYFKEMDEAIRSTRLNALECKFPFERIACNRGERHKPSCGGFYPEIREGDLG